MPSNRECRKNAKILYDRFHIPNICMAMDGCHSIWEEAPRKRGELSKEAFLNRKLDYSLNCLVTAGNLLSILKRVSCINLDFRFQCEGNTNSQQT